MGVFRRTLFNFRLILLAALALPLPLRADVSEVQSSLKKLKKAMGSSRSDRTFRIVGIGAKGEEINPPRYVDFGIDVTMAQYLRMQSPVFPHVTIRFKLGIPFTELQAGDSRQAEQELRNAFDSAIETILETQEGLKIAAGSLACDPFLIAHQTAVSLQTAARIANFCASHPVQNVKRHTTPPISGPVGARVFAVILSDKNSEPWDAYSTGSGFTKLVFDSLSARRMIAVLAHELAVQFDGKGIIQGSFFRKKTLAQINSVPLLNEAFVALRAFNFEEAVTRELGWESSYGSTSCLERLGKVRPILENLRLLPWAFRTRDIKDRGVTPEKAEAWLKKDPSLCDELATPSFNPETPALRSGPRPRIGDW